MFGLCFPYSRLSRRREFLQRTFPAQPLARPSSPRRWRPSSFVFSSRLVLRAAPRKPRPAPKSRRRPDRRFRRGRALCRRRRHRRAGRLSDRRCSPSVGPAGSLKWIDNFGIQILLYVLLGWGLNIVVGLAGLLDLGYVAFYAVGAYAYALLSTSWGWSFWVCLPVAGAARRALGRRARLPGAASARRLSRHRHPGVRRDHPHRSDQLDGADQWRRRHQLDPAHHLFRLAVRCRPARIRGSVRAQIRARSPGDLSCSTSFSRSHCSSIF